MVNVIPPDHVDDVLIVEPNQHDDVPVVPKLVLVDEDEDLKEEELKEEEDPQEEEEEEDDMEVDFEKDENEPELTYPYEEVDPLNPPSPASESKPKDVSEAKNPIEHEDKTVPASVYEAVNRLLPLFLKRMAIKGKAKDKYYGKLILDLGNEVCSSVEQGTAAMKKLVEKLGNAEDKAEGFMLKERPNEAIDVPIEEDNERVERDLYWTRVRAHEFYQEMIRRGFMLKERSNEAIDVLIKEEKSPSSEP
nr:hypothetical protein [Tanacetum cinerariifolium]